MVIVPKMAKSLEGSLVYPESAQEAPKERLFICEKRLSFERHIIQ